MNLVSNKYYDHWRYWNLRRHFIENFQSNYYQILIVEYLYR
jgi:hypothetical protein